MQPVIELQPVVPEGASTVLRHHTATSQPVQYGIAKRQSTKQFDTECMIHLPRADVVMPSMAIVRRLFSFNDDVFPQDVDITHYKRTVVATAHNDGSTNGLLTLCPLNIAFTRFHSLYHVQPTPWTTFPVVLPLGHGQ